MEIEEIKHLASLARIRISDEEAEALKEDISAVLEYVSVVDEIAADSGMTKKLGARYNIFRQDVVTNEPGYATEDLLAEAPKREGNLLKVKKILNQD